MKHNKEVQAAEIWNEDKAAQLKDFVLSHSKKQSKERKLKNELLAIQYQIEDYIANENSAEKLRVLDFVKMYLKVLNVTQKRLADLFEMQDSNLHKYLIGERKLNAHIALKLSAFSHTEPEYWLRIDVKNELFEITKEKAKMKEYQKYDYRHLLAL
jgi:plasmid maintenance system antidote protein VapI